MRGKVGLFALLVLAAALAGCLSSEEAGGPAEDRSVPQPLGPPAPPPAEPDEENRARPENASTANATGGFSDTDVFPGNYTTDANHSHVLAPGAHELASYELVNLTSEHDGAAIQMGLARPDVPEGTEVPVIVQASPYYGPSLVVHYSEPERNEENLEVGDFRSNHNYGGALVANYVPHGYAVALLAVRGTVGSGGCMDLFGPAEQADLDQAATWLGTRGWSNGNVGFFGLSYDGGSAWTAAASGNPHVETIVPAAGIQDAYRLAYPNGTVSGLGFLHSLYYAYSNAVWTPPPTGDGSPQLTLETAACPEAVEALAASTHATATRTRDATGWWAQRNHRPAVEANYNGSVLLVQGLQDPQVPSYHQFPWVNSLAEDLPVKLLLGQWDHTRPDDPEHAEGRLRWDFAETMLHWFDYWLKGDDSVDLGPRVQVADSEGQWRSADAWPPAAADPHTLHLAPGERLQPDPSDEEASVPVGPDPVDAVPDETYRENLGPDTTGPTTGCTGCAVFQGQRLDSTLRFAGRPSLNLTVTPGAPGGYLTAELYHVDSNWGSRHLTGGQINLRFAHGGEEPRPVVPGQPLAVNLTLDPVDAGVPANHYLLLVVSQAGHGEDTFAASYPDKPTPLLLEVGGEQSTLTLETFEVDEDAFFTPPGFGAS